MGVMLLGKIKIHEIAKKLGLTSKEVLERLGLKEIIRRHQIYGKSRFWVGNST